MKRWKAYCWAGISKPALFKGSRKAARTRSSRSSGTCISKPKNRRPANSQAGPVFSGEYYAQTDSGRKAASNLVGGHSSPSLVMNRSGPVWLPQLGGDRTGSGSRVAGADLVLPGLDPAPAGPGLVPGAGGLSPGPNVWRRWSSMVLIASTLLAACLWGLRLSGLLGGQLF